MVSKTHRNLLRTGFASPVKLHRPNRVFETGADGKRVLCEVSGPRPMAIRSRREELSFSVIDFANVFIMANGDPEPYESRPGEHFYTLLLHVPVPRKHPAEPLRDWEKRRRDLAQDMVWFTEVEDGFTGFTHHPDVEGFRLLAAVSPYVPMFEAIALMAIFCEFFAESSHSVEILDQNGRPYPAPPPDIFKLPELSNPKPTTTTELGRSCLESIVNLLVGGPRDVEVALEHESPWVRLIADGMAYQFPQRRNGLPIFFERMLSSLREAGELQFAYLMDDFADIDGGFNCLSLWVEDYVTAAASRPESRRPLAFVNEEGFRPNILGEPLRITEYGRQLLDGSAVLRTPNFWIGGTSVVQESGAVWMREGAQFDLVECD